ncbi:hypothetical protein [Acidovorax sp. 62]|uniref:hypothetical protein n=1 Tax=Acidovorax sp. 62 TaxID=2035203 RepID=UPI001177B23A|nr:hypothetical protein [Acidovorax sp. 62]
MFAFLRKTGKKDPHDLEQLIFDIAEHKRDSDFHHLYKMMVGRDVFAGIDPTSIPSFAKPGISYTTQASDRLVMKSVTIPSNGTWSSAATLPSHPSLKDGYVGMPWVDFLKMTLKLAELQGAMLQGKTSWIAFDKQRIAYVLSKADA